MNDCFSCNYQFSSIVCLKARINAEAAHTQCQVADREVKSTASACNLDSYMISTLRCHYCDVVIFGVQIFWGCYYLLFFFNLVNIVFIWVNGAIGFIFDM